MENCPFAGAEGFVTLMADEALLLLQMDTNIALTSLASGMAVPIGAKYGRGPMTLLLAVSGNIVTRSMSGPHFLYNFTAPRFGAELPPRPYS